MAESDDTLQPTKPIDLREIDASASQSADLHSAGSPTGLGPSYIVEDTRRLIAFILLGILGLVIVIEVTGGVILAVNCWYTSAKDGSCPGAQASLGLFSNSLGAVFTAMVGLVGSVVGFYFGSKSDNK